MKAKYKIGQEVSYNYYSGIFRTGTILKIIKTETISENSNEIYYTYDVKYGKATHEEQHVRESDVLADTPKSVRLVVEANELMKELADKYNRLKDACNISLKYDSETKQRLLATLLREMKGE